MKIIRVGYGILDHKTNYMYLPNQYTRRNNISWKVILV